MPMTTTPVQKPTAAENNIALTRRLYAAIAAGDRGTLAELLSPDVTLHVPGEHAAAGEFVGLGGFAAFTAASEGLAPGGTVVEIHDILGGSDHAAVYCTARATRPGRPPLENATVHLLEIREGRVTRIWFHNRDQAAVQAFWG